MKRVTGGEPVVTEQLDRVFGHYGIQITSRCPVAGFAKDIVDSRTICKRVRVLPNWLSRAVAP
jgi:hypothetical protein